MRSALPPPAGGELPRNSLKERRQYNNDIDKLPSVLLSDSFFSFRIGLMRIAFIHNEKKIGTGAHFINDLMMKRLRDTGVRVKNFYPKNPLLDAPVHLKGLANILFFYSLLEN